MKVPNGKNVNISLANIDEIFFDKEIARILPELTHLFDKWTFGKKTGRESIAKEAALEFVTGITQDMTDRLAKHFGRPVAVRKINHRLVDNHVVHVNDLEKHLNSVVGNLSISRCGDLIYICVWR